MSTSLEDLPAFDVAALPSFYASQSAQARNAAVELADGLKLVRRAAKRQTLHLLNVANAAAHIERLPEAGETFHCVMKGNFHSWDLAPAILKLAAPAAAKYLGIATLGFNKSNAAELLDLFDRRQIGRIDFIASCYFRSTCADEFGFLHAGLSSRGQRCVAVRSHAKIMLFELTDGRALVIESSANLRSCRNVEQFTLTHDRGLLDFHRGWMTTLINEAIP